MHFPSGSGGAAGSKARRPCTSATRSPGPPPQPCSLLAPPLTCPACQGAEGNRSALGGFTLISERRGSGRPDDCHLSQPWAWGSPEHAGAEVCFLQRVGLHLRVQWEHCPGPGRAWSSAALPGHGEALAALGGELGDAGRALRTTDFRGWSTHSPPGLRLPRLQSRQSPQSPPVTGSVLPLQLWEK